jgi:hypothetical protein
MISRRGSTERASDRFRAQQFGKSDATNLRHQKIAHRVVHGTTCRRTRGRGQAVGGAGDRVRACVRAGLREAAVAVAVVGVPDRRSRLAGRAQSIEQIVAEHPVRAVRGAVRGARDAEGVVVAEGLVLHASETRELAVGVERA